MIDDYIYYANMNYPKDTNVKVSEHYEYTWDDENFPETSIGHLKNEDGSNKFIRLEHPW